MMSSASSWRPWTPQTAQISPLINAERWAVGGMMDALKKPVIPLLIKGRDGKAPPHLREKGREGAIVGGFQSLVVSLWCIWWEGASKNLQETDSTEPQYLQPAQIPRLLRKFRERWARRELAVSLKQSLPPWWREPALPHFTSGPTPWSLRLAGMISNLDDFSTSCMKMKCYLPLPGLLPIHLT